MVLTKEIISVIMLRKDVSVDNMGILLAIKQMLPSLPVQERKVADYVLSHPYEAVGRSITGLACVSGVGNTTVSRLCRRLGMDGYRQFKIELAKETGSPENLIYTGIKPGETLTNVAQRIFATNIQALRDTRKVLDMGALEQVVAAILHARRVDIYSTGGAGIAARELHFKCMQLGINANAFLDSQMQVMSAASLTREDVGFGISHSGMQRHVAEALRLAGSAGATTVALTSFSATPVAEAADIVLYTASLAADVAYDSPSVRNAQLAVVDVVYEALLMQGQELARDKMARVAKSISDHLAG
jgi:DNA-binding MurR/RpiR family transcriptional regulator